MLKLTILIITIALLVFGFAAFRSFRSKRVIVGHRIRRAVSRPRARRHQVLQIQQNGFVADAYAGDNGDKRGS